MKKNLLLVMGAAMMLVFGISSCSSSDDEIDLSNSTESYLQETQCYTIRINGNDENGIVSGSIIKKLKSLVLQDLVLSYLTNQIY